MGNQQETAEVRPMKGKEKRYYLAGFADAEGCFSISLKKEPTARFGWALDPVFHVTQHKSGKAVLEMLRTELKCGRIIQKSGQNETYVFLVDNRRQLTEKVIPFFRKHRLVVKQKDFQLFSEIIEDMNKKLHWTREGFIKLVKKAFRMNLEGKQRKYTMEEIISTMR